MDDVMNFAVQDGTRLPVAVWRGGDTRTPIVLLHSLFFDATMFMPLVELSAGNRMVVAPTFRGQGTAKPGQAEPNIAQLADDLSCTLVGLGISRAHIVGSSMGGYVAMEFLRHNADRVASLTLSCCTCEVEQRPERFAALSQFVASGPHPDTGARIAGIMFGTSTLDNPSDTVSDWIERFAKTPPSMSVVIDAMFAHPAYDDVLAGYDGPSLLIAGAEDRAKSPADMARIASHLRQPRSVTIERSGHTPAVETPVLFAAAVNGFIADCEAQHRQMRKAGRHV